LWLSFSSSCNRASITDPSKVGVMGLRVLFPVVCAAALLISPAVAQFGAPATHGPIGQGRSFIHGTLYGPDGAPLGGVLVEVRDLSTGIVTASTYTQSNGSFQLDNVGSGNYEVISQWNGAEGKQLVSSFGPSNNVQLRLDHSSRETANGRGESVSVAQLKVPQKARERYEKAQRAYSAGKLDEAEKSANESLSIYPWNPQAIMLLGLLALQKRNTGQAIEYFQKAIDLDPNYGPPYMAMGAIYNSLGKYDEAAHATERAVAIAPTAWQGYFEMARAYVGKGMYQQALQVAEKAQSLGAGNSPGLHLIKAYAMVPLKLYKNAAQELQAFLSHPPQGANTEPVKHLLAQVEAAELSTPATPVPGMSLLSH
jgi:predicted Zn-dependent protease